MKTVEFTQDRFNEFKRLYNEAVGSNRHEFMFNDNHIYVQYAKYVIEYLEQQFNDA